MTQENSTPPPSTERADYTVSLTARLTIPAAFSLDDVDRLAESLVNYVGATDTDLHREYGPHGTTFDPYISAVSVRSRVDAHVRRSHVLEADWGHGDRCQCHHARVDHVAPEAVDGAAGRCIACGCGQYVRLNGEANQ